MSHLTKIAGVPDKDRARPGMAHFAGSGPPRMTCGECIHRKDSKPTICMMFTTLTGKVGPPVRSHWHACRYFEERMK
jgi:hypothetical protein